MHICFCFSISPFYTVRILWTTIFSSSQSNSTSGISSTLHTVTVRQYIGPLTHRWKFAYKNTRKVVFTFSPLITYKSNNSDFFLSNSSCVITPESNRSLYDFNFWIFKSSFSLLSFSSSVSFDNNAEAYELLLSGLQATTIRPIIPRKNPRRNHLHNLYFH